MKYTDYVQAPYGRGTCRVCKGDYNLNKSGKVRKHLHPVDRTYCEGSYDWPRETP